MATNTKEEEGKGLKLDVADDSKLEIIQKPGIIKKDDETNTAKVSLYDCLACSGCVTSSEVVLMQVKK